MPSANAAALSPRPARRKEVVANHMSANVMEGSLVTDDGPSHLRVVIRSGGMPDRTNPASGELAAWTLTRLAALKILEFAIEECWRSNRRASGQGETLELGSCTMSVGRICVREVDTATPGESVTVAAQRMHDRGVGALVVVNEAYRVVGVVTGDRKSVV